MRRNNQFLGSSNRRWKNYLAATAGAMAVGVSADRADAAILYFNPDDVSLSPTGSLYFDLDNSSGAAPGNVNNLVQSGDFAGADFVFNAWDYAGYYHYIELLGSAGSGNQLLRTIGSPNNGAGLLAYGEYVSSATSPRPWSSDGYIDHYSGQYSSEWKNNGINTGYLGLRIDDGGGNYRYGWARMTLDDPNNTITLHDFAIEMDANTAIQAGFGVSAGPGPEIPEPSTLLLAAIGSAGLLALRKRKKSANDAA